MRCLILLVSLPKLMGSSILKTPQSLALIGLAIAASFSVLIAYRWPMGAVYGFLRFIPNVFAFFLVCLHCNSKRKLQVLVLMLLFVCLFVIARGAADLRRAVPESPPSQSGFHGERECGSLGPAAPLSFEQRRDDQGRVVLPDKRDWERSTIRMTLAN